jgi:hypothetical protein
MSLSEYIALTAGMSLREWPLALNHRVMGFYPSCSSESLPQKLAALEQVALYSVVPGRAAIPLGGTAVALLPTKKEQQEKKAGSCLLKMILPSLCQHLPRTPTISRRNHLGWQKEPGIEMVRVERIDD